MNRKLIFCILLTATTSCSRPNLQRDLVGHYLTGGGINTEFDLNLKPGGDYELNWSGAACETYDNGIADVWSVRELGMWRVNTNTGTVVIKSLHIKGEPEGEYASRAEGEYRLEGDELVPIESDDAHSYRAHWFKLDTKEAFQ